MLTITTSPSIRNDWASRRPAISTMDGKQSVQLVAVASEATDAQTIPAHHQPVAVVLDLMNPVGPEGGREATEG